MVALRQVWVFAQWVSSNLNSSWNQWSQLSWPVSWVSTVWSSLSSSSKRVNHLMINLVPTSGYKANAAYAHLASGLCCGFSSLVRIWIIQGCRFGHRYCRWRRCQSQRATGQNLCWNDLDLDFRISARSLRSYRVTHPNITRLNELKNAFDC